MNKKQQVIAEIYRICRERGNLVFDNKLVKSVSKKYNFENAYDATKFDNSSKLPEVLIDDDYYILHLGQGRHKFVKGINHGYHIFEDIPEKNVIDWKYRKSILNEFDTSESNILSVAVNQRVAHDFLYEDIVASPKMYNARRTKMDMSYKVGHEIIEASKLQMEIDLTMEYQGQVTVFEGKNGFPKDFAIYQLFHPFIHFSKLKNQEKLAISEITGCYVLRKRRDGNSVLRLYLYTFAAENRMDSLSLLRSAQYNLTKR